MQLVARVADERDLIESLIKEVRTGFAQVEARLDGVEARLDGVEARLERVEARLDGVEGRLDTMNNGQRGISSYLSQLEALFLSLQRRLQRQGVQLAEQGTQLKLLKQHEEQLAVLNQRVFDILWLFHHAKEGDGHE
jgi:chromosome segregation ATPase